MTLSNDLRPISLITGMSAILVSAMVAFWSLSNWGWDFQAYQHAVQQLQKGDNPYQQSAGPLPFFYPPVFLKFYALMPDSWPCFAALSFILVTVALARLSITFGTCAIFASGFLGTHIAVFSGNFAAIEFGLVCLAGVSAHKNRYLLAGLLLSIILVAKITPIIFLPAVILWLREIHWRPFFQGLMLGLFFFLVIHLTLLPDLSWMYLSALLYPQESTQAILFSSYGSIDLLSAIALGSSKPPPCSTASLSFFFS